MKKLSIPTLLLAAALVPPFASCTQDESQAAGQSATNAITAAKDMGAKAAQQIASQFEEYRKSADQKLAGVDTTIADLKSKAEGQGAEAKAQIDELVTKLSHKKDEIAKSLSGVDLPKLDAKSFEDFKTKVQGKIAELQKLLEEAKQK